MQVIWKTIDDTHDTYAVSNDGRFKNIKTNKVLKLQLGTNGYLHTSLKINGKFKTWKHVR